MRLWHKNLIPVLPKNQLVSQWRECCCIAKNLELLGTPNHILVNKILDYPITHFIKYTKLVVDEMQKRGYRVSNNSIDNFYDSIHFYEDFYGQGKLKKTNCLFENWHNDRYFWQCYFNLQEKFDCGGIKDEEWLKIKEVANSCGCSKWNGGL